MMGIVGAVLVTCWSWGLLAATGSVPVDRQAPDAVCTRFRKAIEAEGAVRSTDWLVWSIGPARYSDCRGDSA